MREWADARISGGRRRGLLDEFLARTALLAGIYLTINIIHQQAYLSLGVQFGFWPIASTLPLLSDFFIGAYSLILWAILTRIPDPWFNHIAETANLARRVQKHHPKRFSRTPQKY